MKTRYKVRMEQPWTHYFTVWMRIEDMEPPSLGADVALAMPVWTPGSYLVREFSRNVIDLAAVDGAGRPLTAVKSAKDRWSVSTQGSDVLEVTYRVYAFRHETSQSYLDVDHAIVNGASVFLFVVGHEREPLTVEVVPPASWKVVSTGLVRRDEPGWVFEAPDYDVLVDSPIEAGNQHVRSFEVDGVEHQVAIYAPRSIDEARLTEDLRKIVAATAPVFGEIPYARYLFMIDFTDDGFGGLEHLNSTLCIASYLSASSPPEYRKMLSLFSHEFFHAWNVKRMRPEALGPFDYSRENYTRSLWISEGITSYYDNLILRRANLISVPEFLDLVCEEIDPLMALPSSRRLSPEESSFDTWIKFYREDENSPNVSPSYYRQGSALGTILDLEIRRSSSSEKSLDYAMREVYRETFKRSRGFTDMEFQAACSKASGGATDEIFERFVRGRDSIDFGRYLGYAGLTLQPKKPTENPEGFLGLKVSSIRGLTVVSRLSDSPAEAADLSAGDEIIALDGLRMDGQRLSYCVANAAPGSEVTVTFAREGLMRQTKARLSARPVLEHRIQRKEVAGEAEKALFRSWARSEGDEPLRYQDYRTSPGARKALDYV